MVRVNGKSQIPYTWDDAIGQVYVSEDGSVCKGNLTLWHLGGGRIEPRNVDYEYLGGTLEDCIVRVKLRFEKPKEERADAEWKLEYKRKTKRFYLKRK